MGHPMNRASRWLWAAAVAGIFAAADVALVLEQPAAELIVEMRASENSHAKVFFDTGEGFTESDSVTRLIRADSVAHRLSFPLPAKPVHSIRFDPLEFSGVVQIRGLFIRKTASNVELARLDSARVEPLNEIASLTPGGDALEVKTAEPAGDPQLLIPLEQPLRIEHSAADLISPRNRGATAFFTTLALGAAAVALWWPKMKRPVVAVNSAFDKWSLRSANSSALRFDRTALWFYTLCLVAFVLLSLGKFHGSSISIASASYRNWTDVEHTPLLGTPKRVRSDEWSFHTPTILNQLYRRDALAVNDTLLGPGKAALVGNVPCWHFTQLFRPQFWGFFILPAELAFSIYWQCKGLILLTGVFSLLLVVTRSSAVAALCALWFFFSAFTQWAYSWASLLPEMIGLFCWTIALTCYLTTGRDRLLLSVAAIACAGCAINFALCAYPPHQLPLVAFGFAFLVGWLWSQRNSVWRRDARGSRLLALAGCWIVLVPSAMALFYFDARETLAAAAATVYPGQRSMSGGGIPLAQLISHFLDFWKSEENFPAAQVNICEASGYLWLAPVTLLLARPPKEHRHSTALLVSFWVVFLLLLSWMLFPIPASAARWIFFDRVPPFRSFHALGLINVAIVGLFISERIRAGQSGRMAKRDWLGGTAAVLLLLFLLWRMNNQLSHFFSIWSLIIGAIYVFILIIFLAQARTKAFAALLLIPLAIANGLINPVDRNLEVVTASSLFKATHGPHNNWRDGKWLIYSPWADTPGLLAATGIDVVDCLKIVPDRKSMAVFDPDNRYSEAINRSSYFFAIPIGANQPSSFEVPSAGNVLWRVHPLDPRLGSIGVDRVAFAYQPPASEFKQQLAPFLEETFPGLTVYRLRQGD
jgi:ABC-type multidrug transport system fused ATPase/permease subunit